MHKETQIVLTLEFSKFNSEWAHLICNPHEKMDIILNKVVLEH